MSSSEGVHNATRPRKDELDSKVARKRARDRRAQQAKRDRYKGELDALKLRVNQLSQQLVIAREIWDGHAAIAGSSSTMSACTSSSCASQIRTLRRENRRLRQQLAEVQLAARSPRNSPCLPNVLIDSSVLKRWWHESVLQPRSPPPGVYDSPTSVSTSESRLHSSHPDTETAPLWLASDPSVPRQVSPTCPPDRILQAHADKQRRASCKPSLAPDELEEIQLSTSRVVADLLDTYEGLTLPKKVACLYLTSCFVNWLIFQTEDAYKQMPVWMRPCTAQLEIPHPAWMDRVQWPRVRDYLVRHQDITFDEYSDAFSLSFNVNWPFANKDVIMAPTGPELENAIFRLSPLFEEHVRNLNNWTVGPRYWQYYPNLGEAVDQDHHQFGRASEDL